MKSHVLEDGLAIIRNEGGACSKCSRWAPTGQRYCRNCHADYMHRWRMKHPRSGTKRKRKWHKLSEHLEALA